MRAGLVALMLVGLTGCECIQSWNEIWGVQERERQAARWEAERAQRPMRTYRVNRIRGPGPLGRTTIYHIEGPDS